MLWYLNSSLEAAGGSALDKQDSPYFIRIPMRGLLQYTEEYQGKQGTLEEALDDAALAINNKRGSSLEVELLKVVTSGSGLGVSESVSAICTFKSKAAR